MDKNEPWATHMYPLITCALNTKGPILELGCGWYSTPMLHGICKAQGRNLLSYEFDEKWAELFVKLITGFHTINVIKNARDWQEAGLTGTYGVIFVDHSPAPRRQIEIERLKDSCEFMVVHDTDKMKWYGYNFSMFKYKYTYKRFKKTTTILSNVRDPKELFE